MAKDAIEERLGVKPECDCPIMSNEIENRRKALVNAIGADFGKHGWDYDFFITLYFIARLKNSFILITIIPRSSAAGSFILLFSTETIC